MTTVEKLLVQIFEQKNSITKQVKQQRELHRRHLASKILIHGITPPSWLWNPNNSSDSKELNKEELISKLLLPYPQPSVRSVGHYPVYSNPTVTSDNEELSDVQNLAFDEGLNRQDDPPVPALNSEDQGPCVLNSVNELDTSVTSPKDQTDERILNIYNASDQSVAGIQRSKSRQKALELRNSAKVLAKSGLRHEDTSNVFSSQIRFSLSSTNESGQKGAQPKLAETCVIGSQSCEHRDMAEADCPSKENGVAYSGRVTRSRSSAEAPLYVRGSSTLGCSMAYSGRTTRSRSSAKIPVDFRGSSTVGCSSEDCKDNPPSRVAKERRTEFIPISDSEQADNYVLNEGFDDRQSMSEDCKSPTESAHVPSWSSSQQNACVNVVSDSEIPSHSANADCGILDPSSERLAQEVNHTNELQRLAKLSVELIRRVTRSQTWSNDIETYEPVPCNEIPSFGGIISKSDCKQKSATIDDLWNTSSGQFIPASDGVHNMLDEHTNPCYIGSELVLHDSVNESGSCSSSDAKQQRELESQVAPPPSDSFLFGEPKKLSFNEIDECNLKTFTSKFETMSCSLSVSAESLDKGISGGIDQLSLGEHSSGIVDVSSKGEEAHRNSSKSDIPKNPGNEAENFEPSDTLLKTSDDNSEAELNCEISEVYHEADGTLSKMVDIPDVRIPPVKLHVEHGLESSPERHMEEGDWNSEGKDKGQLVSSASERENLRHSDCHNSAKQSRAESCDCLIENVEMKNPIHVVLDKIKQFPTQHSQMLSCSQHGDSPLRGKSSVTYSAASSHGQNLSLERSFRQVSMVSWPQLKRRKIEHQQTHSFTTSPSFRLRKPHSNQKGLASTSLKSTEINTDCILMDTLRVNKSTDTEIHQEINYNLREGIESTFVSQNGEVGFCYKEKNDCENPSSVITNEQPGTAVVSSYIKESRNSQGCFLWGKRTNNPSSNRFDSNGLGDGQCSLHLFDIEKKIENQNSEDLTLTNTMHEAIESPNRNGASQTQYSVLSSNNAVMELLDVDQSMPVFEGFIVDALPDNGELDFAADGIDLDKLDLPRTLTERASVVAEICRSSSDNSSSHFSSVFEFQGTENLFESVHTGQLEHLDIVRTLSMNSDVGKQLQSGGISGDDYEDTLEEMTYSDCVDYSCARYGWNSRSQPTSPVGKLWEILSSHSRSSEKRLSSNPELTCFPIEEDPSISEENRTVNENANDVQEEIDSSLANHCDERHPFKDLTNLDLNPPMSISVPKGTFIADHGDIESTKSSVSETQDKVLPSPKNHYMNRREIREKQISFIGDTDGRKKKTSSISTNGIRNAKDSINNSISKPILSNKTSLKRKDPKLSLKDSRKNNIVSNITSFIPLIQRKQEATVCAGKRDVKVKALEAAEAAKRLEEKREIERKMKKEALKLERAKLEEKNQRHMELEKKKKEEERKKRDADIISKKRLREEEERKEKEKKRMRVETRLRQREQQEKMRVEKAEKENQRSKDEKMNSKKEVQKESTKKQDKETIRGDDIALKKTETKLTPNKVVMNSEECGTSGQSFEAWKAMHTMDKSPRNEDLIVQNRQEKSYEISPYQCSDDDDDEQDDELPTKKHIPSWASKSYVALLLPLQREMDPDMIFPSQSFCSMDEVLLPRKLQQKQMAA